MIDKYRERIARAIKSHSNVHRPDGEPNVFLFSLPRSGSTWLMELIWSQPGFKCCDEPTDLRKTLIQQHIGSDWDALYNVEGTQALEAYFQGFCSGRLTFMNPNPLRKSYRPHTQRIVFKVIHGCEGRINWFGDTFNGRIVYLTRHPIAVSLSREYFPTLPALLRSEYRRHFSTEQLAYAERVNEHGSKLERGVLSWCLQTTAPLRQATDEWAFVSYEQLIVDPQPIMYEISTKLALPDTERMLQRLNVPSNSSHKSDAQTQQALETGAATRRTWLVEKWREQVTPDEERRLMDILKRFEIDLYGYGEVLPSDRIWIRSGSAATDESPVSRPREAQRL